MHRGRFTAGVLAVPLGAFATCRCTAGCLDALFVGAMHWTSRSKIDFRDTEVPQTGGNISVEPAALTNSFRSRCRLLDEP